MHDMQTNELQRANAPRRLSVRAARSGLFLLAIVTIALIASAIVPSVSRWAIGALAVLVVAVASTFIGYTLAVTRDFRRIESNDGWVYW
jgi:hypothetical protein